MQLETVIKVDGEVVNRSEETVNKDINTGEIEVSIKSFNVLGKCKELLCQYLVTKNIQKRLD